MDAAASESLLLATGALVAGLVLLLWSADPLYSRGRSYGAAPRHDAANDRTHGGVFWYLCAGDSGLGGGGGTLLLAVGNALGSNITNIGLVLGVTALLVPLPCPGACCDARVPGF